MGFVRDRLGSILRRLPLFASLTLLSLALRYYPILLVTILLLLLLYLSAVFFLQASYSLHLGLVAQLVRAPSSNTKVVSSSLMQAIVFEARNLIKKTDRAEPQVENLQRNSLPISTNILICLGDRHWLIIEGWLVPGRTDNYFSVASFSKPNETTK